jgi:hypothetical protein
MGLFDVVGRDVVTPYGKGAVKSVKDNIFIVEPKKWVLANGKAPLFYMNQKDVKILFLVGDEINCTFGNGRIKEIRVSEDSNTCVFVVTLSNWILANGKSPILYLQENALCHLKYHDTNMIVDNKLKYAEDSITKATMLKNEAGK